MKITATLLFSSLIAILALSVKGSNAADAQSITQKAQHFLFKNYAQQAPLADTRITIKPIPEAIETKNCNTPISFILRPDNGSRVSLKANCDQPKWSVYISANIEQWQPVAVTSRTLTKGTILGDSDIYLKPFDVRKLTSPYFTNAGDLIGRSIRRSLTANQLLSPAHLDKHYLIKKGDLVYIEANKGSMTVRMTGTAQQNGTLGEQIPVTNSRSGKIVHGYVTSRGVVRVSR